MQTEQNPLKLLTGSAVPGLLRGMLLSEEQGTHHLLLIVFLWWCLVNNNPNQVPEIFEQT